LQAIVAIGTCEGRALVYKVDSAEVSPGVEGHKAICRTQAGTIFGQVCGLNLTENGQVMMATSNSGELMSFDLRDSIRHAAEE